MVSFIPLLRVRHVYVFIYFRPPDQIRRPSVGLLLYIIEDYSIMPDKLHTKRLDSDLEASAIILQAWLYHFIASDSDITSGLIQRFLSY